MKTIATISAILAAFSLSSCKESETTLGTSVEISAPDPALEKYFTDEAIADGQQITAARTTAKPGDEISLSGLVMGREKVFVDNRASFILGDPTTLTPCNKMPDDHCETPWDACCDDKKLKLEGTASIQIVGEDGRVLSGEIRGTQGLKELSSVTITGTVAPQSSPDSPDSLVVNATKIHVSKP